MPITINEIVKSLDMQSDDPKYYLDRKAGRAEPVSHAMVRPAEEGFSANKLPLWQRHELEIAKALLADPDRFVPLPTKDDVDEWQIMQDFAESVEQDWQRDDLLNALGHGEGARDFQDTLRRYRREKDWHQFREEALYRIALDWCAAKGIEYRRD